MSIPPIKDYNPYAHMPTVYVDGSGKIVGSEATPLGEGQVSAVEAIGRNAHLTATETKWSQVRAERDTRLAETDWVALKAVELGQPVPQEWSAYRQALRDITSQRNPFEISWPVAPAVHRRPLELNTTPPSSIPVSRL